MNIKFLLFFILLPSFLTPVGVQSAVACGAKQEHGVEILASSKIRIQNQIDCFAHEYAVIRHYRDRNGSSKTESKGKPSQVVGLGLSGGGIKSSAFQLGLLSGLHKVKNSENKPLLYEVDYIASVSGGSWANGAYMANAGEQTKLFDCLGDLASSKAGAEESCGMFAGIMPTHQDEIKGSGAWQKQIVEDFLNGDDVPLKRIREQFDSAPSRPFPIFVSTHSNTIIGKKDAKNFVFEFTPYAIGTNADCNTLETPCGFFRRYFRPLHWNNSPEQGFNIHLPDADALTLKVDKYSIYEPTTELMLSHAMWSSGALVAKAFSLHLHINKKDEKIEGVRGKYVLSDGGKADNIGLVPLVERGADLIILSQIAGDAKKSFGDVERASKQVKRLFDSTVNTDLLIQPHHQKDSVTSSLMTRSCIQGADGKKSSIWLIKPTQDNMSDFYRYLKRSKYSALLEYLKQHEMEEDQLMRFPQNDTIKFSYPQKLMYAYFALGEFIGSERLAAELRQWLVINSDC